MPPSAELDPRGLDLALRTQMALVTTSPSELEMIGTWDQENIAWT
jgi:hypothetical protein